ncbi:MAG: hypothetical protein QW500_01915 [Candidatus Micrarchaeia archaeon]
MRGAIVALAIAVVLFVAMSGCLEPQKPTIPTKPDSNGKDNLAATNKTEENITKEIVVGPCRATTQKGVDVCLLQKGICDDISDALMKDSCYMAARECNKIADDDMRHSCQISVGFSECEGVKEQALCKALLTNDSYYCGDNTDCLLKFAYKINSTKPCALIVGDYIRSGCRAAVLGDPFKCYVYEEFEASRKECIKTYARVTGKDGDLCAQITNDNYRDDCYYGVAEASGDYSNCLLVKAYKTRKDCIIAVASKTVNPDICDYSSDFDNDKAYCKVRVAQYNLKPSICQNINVAGYIWGCFADSIVDNETPISECDAITNPMYKDWRNECYKRARK